MVCEIDADLTVHDDFVVERLLYELRDGYIVEDDDDPAEGPKGRPRMD